MKIVHLSVTVDDPEYCAQTLAALTQGRVEVFRSRHMHGAFVCMWGDDHDELIEFLPQGFRMISTPRGADFEDTGERQPYNATHVQLETETTLEHIRAVADERGCQHLLRASRRRGGPLYEVWVTPRFLVEIVSDEVRALGEP